MPNMTAVNVRKRMASRHRKINSRTDTPGEKSLHSGKERDASAFPCKSLQLYCGDGKKKRAAALK